MRGYRRRSAAGYLVGVAISFLLVTQLTGTLLQLPDRPWWGLLVGHDDTVHRVFEGSPADRAGIQKGETILTFAGAPWKRSWERRYLADGSAHVDVESIEGAVRSAWLERSALPKPEVARLVAFSFVSIAFLLIGLVVFLSRSDTVATLFFLMCLLFSRAILPSTALPTTGTYFLDKLVLDIALAFLPAVILHFFLSFPRRSRLLAARRWLTWLIYAPPIVSVFFLIRFDIDYVIRGLPVSAAALTFQAISGLVFVVMIVTGIAVFVRSVRNLSSPLLRKSLKFVLPGTALGILPPLLVGLILNFFPTVEFPGERFLAVTFVLVPLSFAHAIFRYGLMDLEIVVKRSVVYTTLTALLVALYYFVAEVLGSWILAHTGTGRTVLSFAVVFASALLFVPARDKIQAFVERTLYRGRYNYRQTLREFSGLFAEFLEREELVRLLVHRLPEVLQVERATLFVRSTAEADLHLADTRGVGANEVPLAAWHPSPGLMAWWREFDGPIPLGEAQLRDRRGRLSDDERAILSSVQPSVLVFLPRERQVEGILLLGPKSDGEPYRSEDLELLATLGHQAGTSLSGSRLHEEALERRRLEEELSVARRIQATLLPSETPTPAGVEIAAVTRPCQHVGGDFYDFLDFGSEGLGLAVADVSGKGVPAALILSGLQATLRAEAGAESPPEPIVRKINERLCADVQPGSFASLLYGHLDVAQRDFRYVNAGHPAGLVVRRDGSVTHLEEGGILLGVEGSADYSSGSEHFEPGDLLLLYSDGVTDVLNADDEEYGSERLVNLLPRVAHLPAEALLESIMASVERFVGGTLPDDITLLVAKFLPAPAGQESTV